MASTGFDRASAGGAAARLIDFRSALALQGRVIGAMILREMRTRFGHSKFGYFWALGEPIVHVAILTTLFSFISRSAPIGTSIEVFFFTGIIPLLLYMRISDVLTNCINANKSLFTYPMVRPIDAIISRVILEFATILLSAVVIGCVFYMFDLAVIPDSPLRVLGALGMTTLLAAGIGCFNAAVCIKFRVWAIIWSWMQKGTYFIAGMFFVVDAMPEPVRDLLYWLAIAHCIAWVRSGYFAGYESHFLHQGYVWFCALSLLAAGLLLMRAMRHKIYE